jgi:hypothetical protein
MAARLGRVLYWAAFGLAAIVAAVGIYVLRFAAVSGDTNAGFAFLIIAVVVWLIGRALQYVLANE